jgi:hypothetical protein
MFTVLMTCDDCDEETFAEVLEEGDNISVPDHTCTNEE